MSYRSPIWIHVGRTATSTQNVAEDACYAHLLDLCNRHTHVSGYNVVFFRNFGASPTNPNKATRKRTKPRASSGPRRPQRYRCARLEGAIVPLLTRHAPPPYLFAPRFLALRAAGVGQTCLQDLLPRLRDNRCLGVRSPRSVQQGRRKSARCAPVG